MRKRRDHVIGKDDRAAIADIWHACLDDDFGRIVKLLLLTGARRDEVGHMTRAELNLTARLWSLPERLRGLGPFENEERPGA